MVYIFDGIKDMFEIWFDKELSIKEKVFDTFTQIVSIIFFTALIIKLWSYFN